MNEIELRPYPLGRLALYAVACCPVNSGVRIYGDDRTLLYNIGVNRVGTIVAFRFEQIAKSFHIPYPDRSKDTELQNTLSRFLVALEGCNLPCELWIKASAVEKIDRAISETTLPLLQFGPCPGMTSLTLARRLIVPGNWMAFLSNKPAGVMHSNGVYPLIFQSRAAVDSWAQKQELRILNSEEDQTDKNILRYDMSGYDIKMRDFSVHYITETDVAIYRNDFLRLADRRVP